MTLTPKQRRFVEEYLVDFNATQAAIRAGYSKKTAYSQGERLLRHAEVAATVEAGKAELAKLTRISAEEVIEGLVHVSEISKEKIKTPVGQFEVGQVMTAKVMNINSEERRIGLSIKRLDMEDDQELLTDYVSNMGPATSSFGEILRENLQEKLNNDEQ